MKYSILLLTILCLTSCRINTGQTMPDTTNTPSTETEAMDNTTSVEHIQPEETDVETDGTGENPVEDTTINGIPQKEAAYTYYFTQISGRLLPLLPDDAGDWEAYVQDMNSRDDMEPYLYNNIYTFIRFMDIPRADFEALYYSTDLYYLYDYNFDLLYGENFRAVLAYYEQDNEEFLKRTQEYAIKNRIMAYVGEDAFYNWLSETKDSDQTVSWSIPEVVYAFDIPRETLEKIINWEDTEEATISEVYEDGSEVQVYPVKPIRYTYRLDNIYEDNQSIKAAIALDTPGYVVDSMIRMPSFTEETWLLADWGDMVQVDEEGRAFMADETMAYSHTAVVTLQLPDSWDMTVTTAGDMLRTKTGISATKRLEYWNGLYLTSANPTFREERVNAAGIKYYYWTTNWNGNTDALWHFCEFAVPLREKEYLFCVYFLTFPENREMTDPADYFETHIIPVIDSVQIEVLDAKTERQIPVRKKEYVGSADVVVIPSPTFSEISFHTAEWGDYVEDPDNPDRAFVPDESLAWTEAVAWFTMDLPDSWELNTVNHAADDLPRREADINASKRMSYGHQLYLTSEKPEGRLVQWNENGVKYYYWDESHSLEGEVRILRVEVAVPYLDREYLYSLVFWLYPNHEYAVDPVDYFETHVQPILDSIRVEVPQ